MSNGLGSILLASFVALLCVLTYGLLRRQQMSSRLLMIAIAAVALAVVVFIAPTKVQTRGSIDETAAVVLCYLSMVLGMLAEYAYAHAERGERVAWEPMKLLMPICASPIVFIPLLTIAGDVAAGGAFTRPKLMVYLVAFQNGFFWKRFFEERRAGHHVEATRAVLN